MTSTSKAGIQTGDDGAAFIPSSRRADGTTRKEIRVRPGYRPPEDVEAYRNRSAEAWKNRGKGGVPGAEEEPSVEHEARSKNAKRREAARRKAAMENDEATLSAAMKDTNLVGEDRLKQDWRSPSKLATNDEAASDADAEQQKKTRNVLKKLKAVRELKSKKASGEKLSPDQLMKMSKEDELIRDLRKLGYAGTELESNETTRDDIEQG
jgi:partner of Y14 and mago